MSRHKTFQVAGVNITLQPHSPELYVKLWEKLYSMERVVKVRGDTYAMIGTLNLVDPNDPKSGFVGSICKFTKIDKNAPWIDLRSAKEAPAEFVKKEVKIPDYLQPNLQLFEYYFDVKNHRAIVQTNNEKSSFSPAGFETMMMNLLSIPEITKEFPSAEATIEQSREVMKNIMRKGGLRSLRITLKRPNPDGSKSDERKILEELSKQHAKRIITELHADTGKTLSPDERTQMLAKVATSNGHVEGQIQNDQGQTIPVSSRDHPHREPYFVDRGQTKRSAFINAAEAFIQKLLE